MKNDLLVLLFQPGNFLAPRSRAAHPNVVLKCDINASNLGENALFHNKNDLIATESFTATNRCTLNNLPYQFHYFTQEVRELKKQSEHHFNEVFQSLDVGVKFNELMPAVAIKLDAEKKFATLYHFNDTAYHGSIMLKYAEVTYQDIAHLNEWDLTIQLLDKAFPRLTKYRHLLNDTCWYSRWNNGMELERKFTFKGVPNTWALNTALYKEINIDRKLPGFVPELDMDFQVFDYDNHIFEVIEPSSKGYISFIPQTNKKVSVKQKWFEKNAELRKETINADVELDASQFEAKATELAGGEVKAMPPFRRKRFDVNFESLSTGNIFGVYFDICRSVQEPEKYVFSQCEVEYCRSRTMFDFKNVMEEFESICAYVENFLNQQNVEFEQNLFSKLDFSIETHIAMQKEGK